MIISERVSPIKSATVEKMTVKSASEELVDSRSWEIIPPVVDMTTKGTMGSNQVANIDSRECSWRVILHEGLLVNNFKTATRKYRATDMK